MLYNVTKNQEIIGNVRIADNFFTQTKGLMFERKKNFNYALIFPLFLRSRTGAGLHMFFVFFSIDVLFLDEKKRVVEIAKRIRPFTPLYVPKKPSKYFIELPEGKSANIELGDEIKW